MARCYSTMNQRHHRRSHAIETSPETPLMEFIGNHPVLDFHNTLAWPTRDGVNDRIRDFGDLVLWSRTSGLITKAEAARLTRDAAGHRAQGAKAVKEARRLRRL